MPQASPQKRRMLTCREVADLYGVSYVTVKRWVAKGLIGVVRVGPFRAVRITEEEAARHFRVEPGAKS